MQKTSRWFFIQKKTRLRLTNSKPHLVTHSSKLRVARLLRVWSSVTIASCQGDPQPREPLGEDASTLLVPRLPTPLKYPNLLRFLVSQYRLFVRFVQWCQSKSEVSISSVYGWMRLILFPHGSHIAWKDKLTSRMAAISRLELGYFLPDDAQVWNGRFPNIHFLKYSARYSVT